VRRWWTNGSTPPRGRRPAARRRNGRGAATGRLLKPLLKAIERDLHTYRGQSRFTTRAARFALYEAAFRFRLQAWRGGSVPPDFDGLAHLLDAPRNGGIDAEAVEQGLLDRLAPRAALRSFVPKDPDRAGCLSEIRIETPPAGPGEPS
jgi:hypothetical protein